MKGLVVFLCTGLLSGCAMFPQSRTELEASHKSTPYCYAESPQTVTERMRTYLQRCFRSHNSTTAAPVGAVFVPIPITFFWAVDEESTPSGSWFGARGRYGYVLSADISGTTSSCTTTMRVYVAFQTWVEHFETLDKVARNQNAECPRATRP
jgi:hypothetical protein